MNAEEKIQAIRDELDKFVEPDPFGVWLDESRDEFASTVSQFTIFDHEYLETKFFPNLLKILDEDES